MRNLVLIIFTGLFSLLLGTAHANSGSSCCNYEHDCGRWCDPCENFAFLCPAYPLTNCNFLVGAAFLYWEARENNLDYVQTDASLATIGGTLNYAQYDWHPGFRVWAGYQWGCDGWESNFAYTYFKTRGSDATDSELDGAGNVINPLGAILVHPSFFAADLNSVAEAEVDIKLKYQTLDLLLSRPFCVSQTLILKPLFGFRALWLDRHLMAAYEDDTENYVWVIWDSDFSGYGFHGGIDGDINLCSFFGCGVLSMRGRLGGTVVAGHPKVRNIQQSTTDFQEINTRDRNNCIGVTGLNLGAGISWENCFKCFYCLFNVGYEFNQYFNLPQVRRYNFLPFKASQVADASPSNNGNFLVHGLTVSAEINF